MLSVIVIVKNEAANIGRCLASVQWADEIIVLDSGSTDNTITIAKKYTQMVYETDWQGYGIQKQRALEKASSEWVLNIDADEYVDSELKDAISKELANPKATGYRIPIRMCFYGKLLRYSSSPKRHIRLFKRLGACYSNDLVHEKIILPQGSRVSKISQSIKHHSFQDISHVLSKINRYSSYSAKAHIDNGQKSGKHAYFITSILGSWWMFFRCYCLQLGFLDGRDGFLFAIFNAHGTFYRHLKQLYNDQLFDELSKITKSEQE